MRTKTPSSYWFLALRYGALMTNLPVVVFSFVGLPSHKLCVSSVLSNGLRPSPFRCFSYDLVHQVLMLATELVVSVGRGGRPTWTFHHRILGMSFVHRSIRSWSSDLAIAWECLFTFDSIIFSLTVYNGYLTRAVGRGQAMPIHRLMLIMAFLGDSSTLVQNFVAPLPLIWFAIVGEARAATSAALRKLTDFVICHPELDKFDRYGHFLEASVVLPLTRQDTTKVQLSEPDPHHSALMAQMIEEREIRGQRNYARISSPFSSSTHRQKF
ncbi:hypothetical protein DFH08DRAFT_815143 [Mycena albidolilacea]|uniref:Uncharacterized protein n=1 Tax=Mycena albidolilacea TaxID=1033008 RepID=A0AAD6ZP62_9AGAR|nr:hypothetical protein DFH08DRAFT_815143 [Mycena albidolilacea]